MHFINGDSWATAELAMRITARVGDVPNHEYRLYVGDMDYYPRCPRCKGQQSSGPTVCPRCGGEGIAETITLDELCVSRFGCSFLDLIRREPGKYPVVRATGDRPDLLALADAYDHAMIVLGRAERAERVP